MFFAKRDLFAAQNREEVKIFSRSTHALQQEINIRSEDCSYDTPRNMAVSRQENLLFVISTCGFDNDSGQVFWTKVN